MSEKKPPRLRITSDGKPLGTKIVDEESGFDLTPFVSQLVVTTNRRGTFAVLECPWPVVDVVAALKVTKLGDE
jgi:hypothetical protein